MWDGEYVWAESISGYVADPNTDDMVSGDCIPRRTAHEVIQANGHLIAAAPDLLAALKLVYCGNSLTSGEQAVCAAAIAKALGVSVEHVIQTI
jgi:hypothetical protein